MNNLKSLSDEEFVTSFQRAVRAEREITDEVIQHFEDAERRKIYARNGYRSLFEYAVKEMNYSEGAAARRISAMRMVREIPEAREKLLDGRINLTTVSQVAQVRKTKSLAETKELLLQIEGKSKREVERLIEKKDSEVVRVELFLPKEVFEQLRKLQISEGEITLEGYLSKHARKAKPKESTPPAESGNPDSRYVPKAVKRELVKRDEGRCTYYSPDGNRCAATQVEVDHVFPFMLGGLTSLENLRLLCKTHNLLEAERFYGPEKLRREVGSRGPG